MKSTERMNLAFVLEVELKLNKFKIDARLDMGCAVNEDLNDDGKT